MEGIGASAGGASAEEVRTPWGTESELAARKLHPGLELCREEVRRSQRARLRGAMVASVARHGYRASTVATVVKLAGVSRASFYEHFEDKRDCFVATLEAILGGAVAIAERAYGGEGAWEGRAQAALRGVLDAIGEQPAAARLCMIEAYAAGPEALVPMDEAARQLARMRLAAMKAGEGEAPPELARAVIGGLRTVVYRRLATGKEATLVGETERLWRWALAHPPPPRKLPRARLRDAPLPSRAPLEAHIPGERILRGFAAAVSERGYGEVRIAEIAAAARVSQATFYAHFGGKREAMAAALEASGAQLLADALPSLRRSADWPEALLAAVRAALDFQVAEPDFARLRAIEAAAAGPWAVAQRDRGWERLGELVLGLGFGGQQAPGRLELEASIGAFNTLLYERISSGTDAAGMAALAPLGTYLLAVPYAGPEAALAAASALD